MMSISPSDPEIQDAIAAVDEVLSGLSGVVDRFKEDGNPTALRQRLDRWKAESIELLSKKVSPGEAKQLQQLRLHPSWVGNEDIGELIREHAAFLEALREAVWRNPGRVMAVPVQAKAVPMTVASDRHVLNRSSVAPSPPDRSFVEKAKDHWFIVLATVALASFGFGVQMTMTFRVETLKEEVERLRRENDALEKKVGADAGDRAASSRSSGDSSSVDASGGSGDPIRAVPDRGRVDTSKKSQ